MASDDLLVAEFISIITIVFIPVPIDFEATFELEWEHYLSYYFD